MADRWIKLYEKFTTWGWYTDTNTKVVFLHCLLKANRKSGEWRGIHYGEGEFITSIPSLCRDLQLTAQNVRTAINHLISTGEITVSLTDKVTGKPIPKGRIITVNKWNEYQPPNRQTNSEVTDKLTGSQQASNRQVTADKEYIDIKKERSKENIYSRKQPVPYQKIMDLFLDQCRSLPQVRSLSDQRKAKIRNLLKTYTVDDFKTVFMKAEESEFLSGRSGAWSGCSFDWLTKPSNFLKVIEGNYDNKSKKETDALVAWAEGEENGQETDSTAIDVDSFIISETS